MSVKIDMDWVMAVVHAEVPEVLLDGRMLMPLQTVGEQESFVLENIVSCSKNPSKNLGVGLLFPVLLTIAEVTENWIDCWRIAQETYRAYEGVANVKKADQAEFFNSKKEIASFLGFCSERLDRSDECVSWFQKSLEHAVKLGAKDQVDSIMNLARSVEDHEGDEARALDLYFDALQVSEGSGGDVAPILISRIHNSIGFILKNNEKYEDAVRHYEAAIAIVSLLDGEDLEYAAILNNFARAQLEIGSSKAAVSNLKKAQKLLKRSGNSDHPLYDAIAEQLDEI